MEFANHLHIKMWIPHDGHEDVELDEDGDLESEEGVWKLATMQSQGMKHLSFCKETMTTLQWKRKKSQGTQCSCTHEGSQGTF